MRYFFSSLAILRRESLSVISLSVPTDFEVLPFLSYTSMSASSMNPPTTAADALEIPPTLCSGNQALHRWYIASRCGVGAISELLSVPQPSKIASEKMA